MEKVWRGGEVCGKGVEYDRATYNYVYYTLSVILD